ncbi:hypothetical protein [Flavobacterium sp.]|uniref:hypothetical protein n=1 Tax=Flavobacterium sp. TaxID=239 RepID=UPI00286A3EDB|nr:hypothetical protein [Flavobacterium sp.]
MKRIIGLLVVILALQGCKKNQETTAPLPLLKATDCITLLDYDKLKTNQEKADWLVKQGSLVCDSILYPRETEHEVLATDVSVPTSANPYTMSWRAFQTLIGTTVYEKYVGFELDSINNVTKVLMVPKYSETVTTYSVPLFRSVGIKYQFSETTNLEFVTATVKDESKVVIRFKDQSGMFVYYDMGAKPL